MTDTILLDERRNFSHDQLAYARTDKFDAVRYHPFLED